MGLIWGLGQLCDSVKLNGVVAEMENQREGAKWKL